MTRLHLPIPLRWGDLDAFGHVNNATMLRLLEEARCRAFFLVQDSGDEAPPTAVLERDGMGAPGGIATLIARQSIEYLHPVPYRHRPLDVQLWIGSIGGASLDVCYEVHGPEGTEESAIVYARADATIVLVDVASGRPVRIGEEARGAWEPYLEEPVAFSRR